MGCGGADLRRAGQGAAQTDTGCRAAALHGDRRSPRFDELARGLSRLGRGQKVERAGEESKMRAVALLLIVAAILVAVVVTLDSGATGQERQFYQCQLDAL